jgi:CPA1 family monovalent cation:H+ antiporter
MTFGVVVLSIIVQGLSMAPVLRRLGVTGLMDAYQGQYELARGRLSSAVAALSALQGMRSERTMVGAVLEDLERDYQRKISEAEAELYLQKGSIGKETFEHLMAEVDARMEKAKLEEAPPQAPQPPEQASAPDKA